MGRLDAVSYIKHNTHFKVDDLAQKGMLLVESADVVKYD